MLRLCHTLHTSPDAFSRKRSLLLGLCDLMGADAGVNVVAHVTSPRRRENIVSIVRHGAARLCEKQLLAGYLRNCGFAARERTAGEAADASPLWAPVRPQGRWARGRRLQHCVWAPAATPEVTVVACVCIARSVRPSEPFLARERTLLELAHVEMSWIYQPDRYPTAGVVTSLSPRQRQTLQFLLVGHSEKEIAEIMLLSRNTVHHHVKALHRHFGVSSRSELLAKWVRSGQVGED
jgi:DNA-binding CsgD family transcriptional regulator